MNFGLLSTFLLSLFGAYSSFYMFTAIAIAFLIGAIFLMIKKLVF